MLRPRPGRAREARAGGSRRCHPRPVLRGTSESVGGVASSEDEGRGQRACHVLVTPTRCGRKGPGEGPSRPDRTGWPVSGRLQVAWPPRPQLRKTSRRRDEERRLMTHGGEGVTARTFPASPETSPSELLPAELGFQGDTGTPVSLCARLTLGVPASLRLPQKVQAQAKNTWISVSATARCGPRRRPRSSSSRVRVLAGAAFLRGDGETGRRVPRSAEPPSPEGPTSALGAQGSCGPPRCRPSGVSDSEARCKSRPCLPPAV